MSALGGDGGHARHGGIGGEADTDMAIYDMAIYDIRYGNIRYTICDMRYAIRGMEYLAEGGGTSRQRGARLWTE